MNPITLWLDRAQSEFSSPAAMLEAVKTVKDKNSRDLLLRRASKWGAQELAKKHDKHWSKGV